MVSDTGMGIAEADRSRIFEAFERGRSAQNIRKEGLGLGLAIVMQLVDAMDGTLKLYSEIGKGTTFIVRIPYLEADPEKVEESNNRQKQKEEIALKGIRILAVDDNEKNLMVFRQLMKKTEADITAVSSGKEAIICCREHTYDLIFLDHMMPEMDGIETRRNMLSDEGNLCRQVPIVMLTANVTAGAREKYLAEGFCDFLPKPILYDQLEKMLLTYLPKDLVKKGQKDDKDQAQADMELPQIEEFDAEYAMLIWKSPSRYRTGLQEFARDLARAQEKLTTLFDTTCTDETKEDYRRCIHTLKGTAATVGALLLSKTARLIEIVLADGRIDQVQTLHPILMEQIEDAGKHLADYFKDHKDTTAETNENLLEMMQSALENQDLQAVDFLYQQLQDRAWSVDAASVLATLGQDLSEFSWESATRKVEILRTFC